MNSKQRFENFVTSHYNNSMILKNFDQTKSAAWKIEHRMLQQEFIVPASIVSYSKLVHDIMKSISPTVPSGTAFTQQPVEFSTAITQTEMNYRIEQGDSKLVKLQKNCMRLKSEQGLFGYTYPEMLAVLASGDFRVDSFKPYGLFLGVSFRKMFDDDEEVEEEKVQEEDIDEDDFSEQLRFARRLQDNLFNDEDDDGYGYDGENKFGNDDDAW